jgi:hypothetical protein
MFVWVASGKIIKGVLVSEWNAVVLLYARGPLLTDVFAGVPISWVDYFVMPNVPCSEESAEEQARANN